MTKFCETYVPKEPAESSGRRRDKRTSPRLYGSKPFSESICIGLLLFLLASSNVWGEGMVICIEAESAVQVTPPMEVVSATNVPMVNASEVSSGSYLEVAQGRGNPPKVTGEAVIRFEIKKAGQYELWCRVWWDDECGNSFTMVVDDGKPFVFGQDSTFKCWHWVRAPRLKQLYLEPGIHTLRVQNREDGVRLDQILFSSNQRYVPVGIEKPTGDQPNTGQGS